MPGQDGTIYRGFQDTPHIQERLRMYAQAEDLFRYFAIKEAVPLSILTVISEKFGTVPADMITDWKFRYQEFDELLYSEVLTAASAQPASGSLIDYIKVTNNFAAGLNLSHRLSCDRTFTKATVSAHTDVSTTFSPATGHILQEVLKVIGIGEPDSAYDGKAGATGYTWVKVKRAHPATSITGQLPAIPSGSKLVISNSVAKTNARPNPPVAANGNYLENVIQITRESYGVGEHFTQGGGIKTFLKENGGAYLDLNFTLNKTRLMKTIERAILLGRKMAIETNNESEYETGGIIEFIPANNYLNFGGVLNITRINNVVAEALEKSGVRELWWFTGSTLTKKLAAAFENKRGFGMDPDMSIHYAMKVNVIESTGRDGVIYHVNAPILSEIGWDDRGLLLNLTEYNYGEKSKYGSFQIAEKVPMLDLPEDADSYESNSGFRGTWRELYYAFGLVRRLQNTHFATYGAE